MPTSSVNDRRSSSRMQSLGPEPTGADGASDGTTTMAASYSTGALNDYMQRERRSHTMAPVSRIMGPSSTPIASLFATIIAPSDAKAMKSAQLSLLEPDTTTNTLSKPMVIRNDLPADDDHPYDETDVTGDDYDDDDDDTPIIVKVRYDPNAGAPPSEDLIRQAVDNRLKGSSGPKGAGEPLVLDFRRDSIPVSAAQILTRPPQPVLQPSRSVDSLTSRHGPFANAIPLRQQQQQQQLNPELLQRQRQLFQEQQQRQRQQQMIMQQQKQQEQQEQQRKQQQIFMQKQQEQQRQQQQQQMLIQQRKQQEQERQQQIRVMQEKQRHQQMLRQQQQEQQQKLFLQQQKEKLQLEQFLQQQKQQQLRQKLQQEQLQKQQQQREYQMQQQRNREQLLYQQYQQNQQRLYPQADQSYQQSSQSTLFQNQRNPQKPFLPPMTPRLTQTSSTGRPLPTQQPTTIFVPPARLLSTQSAPRAPLPFMNPTQIQNITIERLPARNVKQDLHLRHSYTGLTSH